ncbi:MAG: UDP-glucuronic acid decarboxylase family protein [Acidimicrobiales bacterium]
MRAVVAGGAGMIGSHLCEALLERGDEVICIDNFATGQVSNIEHLSGRDRFTLVHDDVCRPVKVGGAVDAVLHLASPASPVDFSRLPLQILEAGSSGTRNLALFAGEHRARFLLASTSEVYGDPAVHPQSESYWGNVNPVGPRSVYDEAKRFSEALTMALHRAKGLDVRIVRIFNTYGPRLRPDDGRVVSNFISQALRGLPITIYGDGSQTRSFCYVDDEVRGILAVLDSDHVGPVNVGNPGELEVGELASSVVKVVGSSSEIVFRPLPVDDPTRRCPDITLARSLGWEPEIPLEDGLSRTVEHFRALELAPPSG